MAAVSSARLEIELEIQGPGLVIGSSSGVQSVGSINSYLVIPTGTQRVVAVVTGIRIVERGGKDSSQILGMSSLKMLDATMIGRIEFGQFRPGVSAYPALSAAVYPATPNDISRVFLPNDSPSFSLGEAVVSPGQDVMVDANVLLAKHSAVLGSTGSGKSWTVTAMLDGILSLEINSGCIVILDANGEYARAFRSPGRAAKARPLVIGLDADADVQLVLPHWFMNTAEHLSLLRASEGAQAPLLQRAVTDARLSEDDIHHYINGLLVLYRLLDQIDSVMGGDSGKKPQENLFNVLESLRSGIAANLSRYDGLANDAEDTWRAIKTESDDLASLGLKTGNDAWNKPIEMPQVEAVRSVFTRIRVMISDRLNAAGLGSAAVAADFDAPRFYGLQALLEDYLPARINIESLNEPRIKNFASTMLMRLSRILADSRLDFFTRVPRFDDALALYMRLLLGSPLGAQKTGTLLPPWETSPGVNEPEGHQVVIIDLSGVASELVELIATLVGRLVLDLAQRLPDRAAIPILMVLEEAHRYVPAHEESSGLRATPIFERIAKEGRKFGVSLLLASQRPAELSKTLLSQCGTLVVHRIVNSEDQALIRSATPFAGREILDQLSGLAQQHAIVIGEAVAAPSYVRIKTIIDGPRSDNPSYIEKWREGSKAEQGRVIDAVARQWEGGVGHDAVDSA